MNKLSIFKKNLSTLKETSIDNNNTTTQEFMTDSLLEVVNFDGVKNEYIKTLKLKETPKSNDALFFDGQGKVIFIEFKNGSVKSSKEYDLRKKIYDSLLIFTDITNHGITYTRNNMDYILVYNAGKNDMSSNKLEENSMQESESRDKIAKVFMNKGGEDFIRFGLEIFKNYCFSNVYTYTVQEFEEKFLQNTREQVD